MMHGIKKTKSNINRQDFELALSEGVCGCFAVDCCPVPHFMLTSINDDGIDYHWNDSGTLVSGTKEEFDAVVAAKTAKIVKTTKTTKATKVVESKKS